MVPLDPLSLTTSALAYLDPGMGSFFFQTAIAGVLAVSFAVKLWWRELTRRFSAWRSKRRPPPHDAP